MSPAPQRKYWTRKRDVKLKRGETVAFQKGKGYYAKPAPVKKPAAAKVAKVPAKSSGPTSLAPNPLHEKKRPVARAMSKLRLKVVKVRHTVALTQPQQIAAKRAQVVAFLKWGIAHEALIHYAEIRPIPQVTAGKLPALPLTTDCSGFVTMAYQYAGLPDPNGLNYNGQGYTGTLLGHGIPTHLPRPGDIGIYGSKPGHHAVASLNSGGSDLASHGSEHGPLDIAAAVEQQYQPTPLTWLSLEALR